ncbi:transcription termination factor MTERF4, chloroplastic-like [Phragmites australis]|uniref:transcription termination factor MTERF4, chloroplastic-like n=1 Tax=Phragmites australis TaxID=29695 RepID=UPI002D7668D4|nr:transcription termination factor MTERF4, chloroplastic-like [Phragmites australis]
MLRLRRCILSHLLSPFPPSTPSTPTICSLRRLLSATANPFAAEEYLVASCGLSRAQALKACRKISHLKSPSKPDAVLAFLVGLGLSRSDVATVVARFPRLLCADVGKTLAPRVVELGDLGLSRAEIARLVLTVQNPLCRSSLGRNFGFWLSAFGSLDEFLQVLKVNDGLLSRDLEKVAKPNMELLQRCGINVTDLLHTHRFMSRMLTRSTKHLQEALALVDEFGIEQSSWVFPHAFSTFAILSREKLTKNIQLFEKLGWSKDDISLAVRKEPRILRLTEERVRRSLKFLVVDVGLTIPYIAPRPLLMLYSIECRLLPRHCLMKFLKAKGLLNAEFNFDSIAKMSNGKFLHRFVHPHEESVPGLAAAFASSCAGKHQWEQLCET